MRHRPITIDTLHSKQSPTSLETELHITRNRALHHSKQSCTSLETEPYITRNRAAHHSKQSRASLKATATSSTP
ncbi:MAG: hypothetical protein SNJ09_05025 [Rikenellaceae bacterium]